jgi:hypothetical protein
MVNHLLLSLVNSVLGQGKPRARENYAYNCPFCPNPSSTPKLEICFTESKDGINKWGCWKCLHNGKRISTLFKRLKVPQEKFNELKQYVTIGGSSDYVKIEEKLELPKEFKSLINSSGLTSRQALAYLKKRNITENDILRYNIGYCEYGEYKDMVIIPSYNSEGKLNYFMGRTIIPDSKFKRNPQVSRNIVPFELYINWNLPIILCEGFFDAIIAKRNAIPLLGKNIQSELMKKLIQSSVKKIYIALDKDALKQSIKHCEMLMDEGKEVYLVNLEQKDFNEMGFESSIRLLQTSKPLTFEKLLNIKLNETV